MHLLSYDVRAWGVPDVLDGDDDTKLVRPISGQLSRVLGLVLEVELSVRGAGIDGWIALFTVFCCAWAAREYAPTIRESPGEFTYCRASVAGYFHNVCSLL